MTQECFQQMACSALSIFDQLSGAKISANKLLAVDQVCPFLSTGQITALITTLPEIESCLLELKSLHFVVEL